MVSRQSIIATITGIAVGILIGGFIFSDTRPRSFWALPDCGHSCWQTNEIVGLMVAAGIKADLVPKTIKETDKTIVLEHPFPQAPHHYLIFPKKDIKDIGDIGAEDRVYLEDTLLVIGQLVREKGLTKYRVVSNGPDEQLIRYLHFHLLSE